MTLIRRVHYFYKILFIFFFIWIYFITSPNKTAMEYGLSSINESAQSEDLAINSPDFLTKFREWSLTMQRDFLANEMLGYNFEGNAKISAKKLEDLILEKGGKPIRNIIFSTWRSGTTFLGEVLDSHPATYYHYEPLLHFRYVQVRSGELAHQGINVIRELFNCQYNNLAQYTNFGKVHRWLYSHNSRVWQFCKHNRQVCWDPDFLTKMCRLFPFQAAKTVRMRLSLVKPLLDDKDLDIRVVYLVRDPRGTLQSRLHKPWCMGSPDCESPSNLCLDLESDFNAVDKLQMEYPDRLMILRYEDISLEPYSAIKKLFSFFRLQFHPRVQNYLSTHTSSDGSVHSTFRHSKATPFHWKKDFFNNFTQVEKIQFHCEKAMKLWGYRLAKNKFDMMTFNPLLNPPWKEMEISEDS